MKYRRIIIKLSGESLAGKGESGILESRAVLDVAKEISSIAKEGVEIGLVIGAGNICRGAALEKTGVDRVTGDEMGMLGTIINSFAFNDALKSLGTKAVTLTSVPVGDFAEPYTPALAKKYLTRKYVTIFAGGTGKPFFSTDTCAAMRAIETKAEAILIAKHGVKGIYEDDPRVNPNARFRETITYKEILDRELKVMDLSAVRLLSDKDIDVCVFDMADPSNFSRVLKGERIGTVVERG